DADELHDVLLSQGALPISEGAPWNEYFEQLRLTGRAAVVNGPSIPSFWAATERWPLIRAIWPCARAEPVVLVPSGVRMEWSREEAVAYLVRGRLECTGPVTTVLLAETFGLDLLDIEAALALLESEGVVLRGRFTHPEDGQSTPTEWCDRRLLARIHRLTLEGLRRQIAPVPPEQFLRFLVRHQHAAPATRLRGQAGLATLLEQVEGFEAPAGHWEKYLLSSRLEAYSPGWLDGLTFFGQAAWGRIRPRGTSSEPAQEKEFNELQIPIGNGR